MRRDVQRYVGIDLGGARGKTTAVALLQRQPDGGVWVERVLMRSPGGAPWDDEELLGYLDQLGGGLLIAVNAPLTVPACVRCRVHRCPGVAACVDPATVWLRTTGAELIGEAGASERDRLAAVTSPMRGGSGGSQRLAATARRSRVAPYAHRCCELDLHYGQGLVPRDAIGSSTGPIAARASHLTRCLSSRGFVLHHDLIEVSPRATVQALFGRRKARGYKRDADAWETRAHIVESLADLRFAPSSRLSREEVLRNDHCFEALVSAYTGYLAAREQWCMPAGHAAVFAEDGYIWAPAPRPAPANPTTPTRPETPATLRGPGCGRSGG